MEIVGYSRLNIKMLNRRIFFSHRIFLCIFLQIVVFLAEERCLAWQRSIKEAQFSKFLTLNNPALLAAGTM